MFHILSKISKDVLVSIIDNYLNSAFIIDKHKKFIYANKLFFKYTGYTVSEVINKDYDFLIHEDYLQIVNNNFEKRLNNKEVSSNYKIKVNTKLGVLDVIVNVIPVIIDDDQYFVGIVEDITTQNRLVELLQDNELKHGKKKSLQNNFLMNISHEIRTPLNSIIGFVDLLIQDNLPKNKKEKYLEIIKNVTSNLIDIVNDITDLSRIDEQTLKIIKNNFSLNDLITNLKYNYNKQLLESNNTSIQVVADIKEKYDNTILYSDKFRINQILTNLIDNSIKYSKNGNIIISFEKVEDKIIISVKDHGIGISKENLKNIFDRFTEVNYKKKQEGVGLGLTLSKKIAKLLGGDLFVESKLGYGSTFYLSLPYEVNTEQENKLIIGFDDGDYDFSGKKILIVEDEETNFIFLKEILTKKNAQVIWAKNGRQGVKFFAEKSKDIDLILMDIRMPILNGIKATMEIRQMNKKVPIIAQTAYAMDSEKTKSLEAGCNDFVVKPIKKNILFDKINKLLIKKS